MDRLARSYATENRKRYFKGQIQLPIWMPAELRNRFKIHATLHSTDMTKLIIRLIETELEQCQTACKEIHG